MDITDKITVTGSITTPIFSHNPPPLLLAYSFVLLLYHNIFVKTILGTDK